MRRPLVTLAALLSIVVVIVGAGLVLSDRAWAGGGLTTEDLSGALTPDDLANDLVGSGITISNVTYTGADVAAGRFNGGGGIIGFESGIILSTGDIANVVGPNEQDSVTTSNSTAGDAKLDILSGQATYDAAVLEFDFVPDSSEVRFDYVFASDEYNEYVNTIFNDVFAFNFNNVNCALVGGEPVSINTINNGNPYNTDPRSHPELFRNNDLDDGGGSIDTEMDGLTTVLTCIASVNVGVTNHMKLAIADASDTSYDSNVFLEAGSFVAQPTDTPTPTETPTSGPATETPTPAAATETPTSSSTALPPTATPTRTPTRTATPVPPKACGDVDDNGAVNSIDVAQILQLHAGLLSELFNQVSADVNSDNVINSIDAALVLQKEAGLIPQSGLHCPV